MTEEEIVKQVKAIIVDKLGVEESEVTESANFTNDLGADSLDTVELLMEFERVFGIKIPDEETSTIATVKDAIDKVKEDLKKANIYITIEPKIEVQNIVASSDLEQEINLNTVAITLGLEKVEYEPEQFPGLVYRPDDPKVVVLLFGEGDTEERFANLVEEHPLLRVLENGREFRRGGRTDVCLVEPLGRNAVIRPGLRNIRIINRVIGVTHRLYQRISHRFGVVLFGGVV